MKDQYYVAYWDLGRSVAYHRKQNGLTQQNVADIMDISYVTINCIENAATGMTLDTLFALSKTIQTPLSELFMHAGL